AATRLLEASQQRQQAQAQRRRDEKAREEKRRQQREIERRNREAKAARKAEHERRQQEIAAHKAALIAQGITPESHSARKRRLAREAAERAARKTYTSGPAADRSANPVHPRPGAPPSRRDARFDESLATEKPMPKVTYRKKRRIVLPDAPGKS
ncbi:MAG: hypothetical protein KDI50_02935, partial [Candidatus Competibacteraceae bacterium]|nr:hypothetical protein [Candidatus Competibacteraceae bacterium]